MTQLQERRISLLNVGLFYGLLAAGALVASQLLFHEWPVRVGGVQTPVWRSAVYGVALGGFVVGLTRVFHARWAWARALDSHFKRLLGRVTPLDAAFMATTSALAEELLFRGFVLRLLLPEDAPFSAGAIVIAVSLSAIGFGLLHIGPDRSYAPWTVFATVLGAAFGGLTVYTGDITAAVVAHLTINYFNFLAIAGQD